jgi:hypothetical protein
MMVCLSAAIRASIRVGLLTTVQPAAIFSVSILSEVLLDPVVARKT